MKLFVTFLTTFLVLAQSRAEAPSGGYRITDNGPNYQGYGGGSNFLPLDNYGPPSIYQAPFSSTTYRPFVNQNYGVPSQSYGQVRHSSSISSPVSVPVRQPLNSYGTPRSISYQHTQQNHNRIQYQNQQNQIQPGLNYGLPSSDFGVVSQSSRFSTSGHGNVNNNYVAPVPKFNNNIDNNYNYAQQHQQQVQQPNPVYPVPTLSPVYNNNQYSEPRPNNGGFSRQDLSPDLIYGLTVPQ